MADRRRRGWELPLVLSLGQLAAAGAAFLVNLLSASVMTPAERGVLALLLQLTYVGAVLVVLGVERPFVARIEADFQQGVQAFWSLIAPGRWFMLIPILAAGIAFTLGEIAWGLGLVSMAFYLLFNALGKGVRVAAIASGTVRAFIGYTLATQGGIMLLGVTLTVSNTADPFVWYAAYVLTGASAGVIFVAARSRGQRLSIPREEFRGVRREGLRLLPASFGNTALLRSDRLILPLFAGSAQLGIYVVVATVMEIATWPVSHWVDSSLRKWAVRDSTSDAARPRMLRLYAVSALLACGLSVIFGSLSYFAVVYILPVEYRSAVYLIIPLAIAAVVYAISRVQQGILISAGCASRVSAVEITGMVASVVAYLALIPPFGAGGAAYGSIVGYLVTALAGAWNVRRTYT